MTVISQGLTLPGNVVTGGTIQASDVATLYAALNAFTIPGTIGVFQQGFVDNNRYTSTGNSGTIDFPFTTPSDKSIFFLSPFSWTGGTGNNITLGPRVSGANASTNSLIMSAASSGHGMVVGFVGPVSTDTLKAGFMMQVNDQAAGTLTSLGFTVAQSTSDRTSMGFVSSSTNSATIVWHGVRYWAEG